MSALREHESIRVLVIAEERLVGASLVALITSWEGFQVVGEAASKDEAVKQLCRVGPDVVLLSLAGSDEFDSKIVADVAATCGSARLLVLTVDCNEKFRSHVVRLGTCVVLKNPVPLELQRTIQSLVLKSQ